MAFDGSEWFGGRGRKVVAGSIVAADGEVLVPRTEVRTFGNGRRYLDLAFTSCANLEGARLVIWRDDGTTDEGEISEQNIREMGGVAVPGWTLSYDVASLEDDD